VGTAAWRLVRAATAAINRSKRRHSAALSEFEPLFLNRVQRSVHRKVQVRIPGPEPVPDACSDGREGDGRRPRHRLNACIRPEAKG